jgi:hypothetical protein
MMLDSKRWEQLHTMKSIPINNFLRLTIEVEYTLDHLHNYNELTLLTIRDYPPVLNRIHYPVVYQS